MCTTIALTNKILYFGRNMDIECDFNQRIIVVPWNFPFKFRHEGTADTHYAIIGMGTVFEGCPMFADAMNEFGLCGAGLNFPDNACYSTVRLPNKHNVTPFELISWVLSRCKNITDVLELLKNTNVYDEAFSDTVPLTPLHWHFADKTGSLVLEVMKDGMHIYDNPANVLTNNPPLDFHITNLSHYLNLTPSTTENVLTKTVGIKPFAKGLGSFGLPGDFSSTSRFVKAAFMMGNIPYTENPQESIANTFHILDSVAVLKGCIDMGNNMYYSTIYSSCMDTNRCIYYYKTYNSLNVSGVKLFNVKLDSSSLTEYAIENGNKISWSN